MNQSLSSQQQQPQQKSQDGGADGATKPLPAEVLGDSERDLLKKFRKKVDKFEHALCPTCNESFPSIVIVKCECRHCYSEKATPKKFSAENNMDPSDVPDEL